MPATLTVSQLTQNIKQALAAHVGPVRVEGEVSQFTAHRSGHWYFTVKDPGAVLSCVMFRGDNRTLRWSPAVGDQVILAGDLDVYGPRGSYNLIVRNLERAGAGDAAQQLDALKRKLAAEGLFDPARKRRLPPLPRAVGVATSPTGAAFRDILKVLGRRFPGLTIYLAPCRVQGSEAISEIVDALRILGEHGKSDVIIVGRGGGGPEDLACFDAEPVARAIAACPIPVVSAVGHEVDVSIADLVADVRAATPSHAAELVVPERQGIQMLLDDLDDRALQAIVRAVARGRDTVARVRLRDPRQRLADARLRCDALGEALRRAGTREVQRRCDGLARASGRLDALSPLGVLGRGYAVVFSEGRAVRSSKALSPGDGVVLRLHEGTAHATIDRVTD